MEAAEKDPESSSDESSSSSGSNSGSSSEFGLKQADKRAKAAAKPRAKKAPKKKDAAEQPECGGGAGGVPASSQAITEPAKSERSAAGASSQNMSASVMLEKGKACLKSLEEVSPLAIWSGMRAKEIDSRVSKAVDIVPKLNTRPGDGECCSLSLTLDQEIERVTADLNIFQAISASGNECKNMLKLHAKAISDQVASWSLEQLTSFLTETGRKLCDDLIAHSSNIEEASAFFHFISVEKFGTWNGFSFRWLKERADESTEAGKELVIHLAQVQQSLLNYFLDRFRTMSAETVENVLKCIPMELYFPLICRTFSSQLKYIKFTI